MIEYLKNQEIDREQWDNCIKASPNVKPYAWSWYLDNMAPGWEALVDDDYDSVFPLPGFNRFGIHYIATPVFLQQLGAFSPDKPAEKAILEFIDYMPDIYRLIDLCIGQKINIDGYRVTEKVNFELDLSKSYEELSGNFTSDCRRNIQIVSKKKVELTTYVTPHELISLFQNNKGGKLKGIKKRDYERLNNLMTYCVQNQKGRIIGVRTIENKLIFGLFLIETQVDKTVLFTANTPESLERRIGYFVINEIIRNHSSTRTMLDFAGSSIPSVGSFMKSFGCMNIPYYRIYRNNLLWPIRMLK
jgi:hypothetical protein